MPELSALKNSFGIIFNRGLGRITCLEGNRIEGSQYLWHIAKGGVSTCIRIHRLDIYLNSGCCIAIARSQSRLEVAEKSVGSLPFDVFLELVLLDLPGVGSGGHYEVIKWASGNDSLYRWAGQGRAGQRAGRVGQ